MKIHYLVLLFFISAFSQRQSNLFLKESIDAENKKNYVQALKSIDKALQEDPFNEEFIIQKVKLLYLTSECVEGLKLLEKIVTKNTKFSDITISYYSELVDCIGEPQKANEVLIAYAEETNSTEILATIAQRYFTQGEIDKSVQYYNKVIAINPNDINSIVDLARILYSYKSKDMAIDQLNKGLITNSNNIILLSYLSSCYYNKGEYFKAIDIQNKLIQLDEKSEFLASRAMLFDLVGEKEKAYNDNRKIIKLSKCNTSYYLKVLEYEFEKHMYEKVIQHSLELIECNGDNEALVLDGLYTAYFFNNNYQLGKKYLNRKLKIQPNNFNANYINILILFNDRQYKDILKFIQIAKNANDLERKENYNLQLLTLAYYLVNEDYDGFNNLVQSENIGSLYDNVNFKIVSRSVDKTIVETFFNKDSGNIITSLIIPSKAIHKIQNKLTIKSE